MDNKEFQMHHALVEADAKYVASMDIISTLREENKHLRQVIEMLITRESPKI